MATPHGLRPGLTLLALALAAGVAAADTRTPNSFRWDGGVPDDIRAGRVFSAWNARNAKGGLAPGVKVMFFGRADACERDAVNGPTVATGNPRLQQSLELTGIDYDGAGGLTWTPSGDTDQCSPAARRKAGDSFVHLNPDPKRGGVALFTYTGRDTDTGRDPFFHPFEATGQHGGGANAHISGTFFAIRFASEGQDAIAPWSGQPAGREPALVFSSQQSVVRAEVPSPKLVSPEAGTQVKQQMIFTLMQRDCWRTLGRSQGKLCQIQYLLNLAVYRTGVEDWSTVPWFRDAGVQFDPAQNSVAVVHGPVPRQGRDAVDGASGLPLYTSLGAPSQHAEFRDKRFSVRVTLEQLRNALRVATAARLRKAARDVTPREIAAEFGDRWADADSWALLSVNIGQEVYNRDRTRRAFIAGNFRDLMVGP